MGSIQSYLYPKVETNTLTPNSMCEIPENKFINFARVVRKNEDDDPKLKGYELWDSQQRLWQHTFSHPYL